MLHINYKIWAQWRFLYTFKGGWCCLTHAKGEGLYIFSSYWPTFSNHTLPTSDIWYKHYLPHKSVANRCESIVRFSQSSWLLLLHCQKCREICFICDVMIQDTHDRTHTSQHQLSQLPTIRCISYFNRS